MSSLNLRRFGIFVLLAFAILFFVSPNSYTHDLFNRSDVSWFFMCGKAWMNGLIPYVDFADSKGPLLWLIYGIGYLISPYNYIGVFWLSVLSYGVVFYNVFRTTNLFLHDDRKSLLATVLMLLSFFWPWFHYEVKGEDWCQPFIVMSIYYICKMLYTNDETQNKRTYKACFVLGISLAATLLIKFTITVMLGLMSIYILVVIMRQRSNILLSFLMGLVGFSLIVFPFVVYMLYVEDFDAFIHEYFISTSQTLESTNEFAVYMREWLMTILDGRLFCLFVVACYGGYMMSKMVKNNKYFFIIGFLCFYAIAIHHYYYTYPYYLNACAIFLIFVIIPILAKCNTIEKRKYIAIIFATYVATIFVHSFFLGYLLPTWWFRDNVARTDYYNVAYLMGQIKDPTVLNYMATETGRGIPVHAMPATKYWAWQTGATNEMRNEQEQAIRNHIPDFVFINDFEKGVDQRDSLLQAHSYEKIYQFELHQLNFSVYSKHSGLHQAPANFHVSNLDVLLKRNVFKQ